MEYREYYSYIFEDCDCLHEADCGCGQEEGYPWGGYKETESDFADPRLQKMEEISAILEKNIPTIPDKWARAKAAARSKFKVYPSAYANLWAAKKYKSMGGGWKKGKKEEYHIPHKRRDPMGQEDADINNDGKVDLTDKMLKAKRDLYKRYLVAKEKGQKSI